VVANLSCTSSADQGYEYAKPVSLVREAQTLSGYRADVEKTLRLFFPARIKPNYSPIHFLKLGYLIDIPAKYFCFKKQGVFLENSRPRLFFCRRGRLLSIFPFLFGVESYLNFRVTPSRRSP